MKVLVRFEAIVVAVTGLAVVADPVHRGTAVRVGLLAAAAGAAVALVARLFHAVPPDATSPFEPLRPEPVVTALPADLRRLAVDVRAVDVAARAMAGRDRRARLPATFRTQVSAVAGQRLRRRGLDPARAADEAAVRALAGPALTEALYAGTGHDAGAVVAALEQL